MVLLILINGLGEWTLRTFIIGTCFLLFWAFYEMSGGANFEPTSQDLAELPSEVEETSIQATRAAPLQSATLRREDITDVVPASFITDPIIEPAVQEAAVIVEAAAEPNLDDFDQSSLRYVSGDRVNMREGPSTDYYVLDTIARGTKAEVIELSDNGWAQIRLVDTGQVGWMAERLLADG